MNWFFCELSFEENKIVIIIQINSVFIFLATASVRESERLCKTYGGDVKISSEKSNKKASCEWPLYIFPKKNQAWNQQSCFFHPTANVRWRERERENLCVEPRDRLLRLDVERCLCIGCMCGL